MHINYHKLSYFWSYTISANDSNMINIVMGIESLNGKELNKCSKEDRETVVREHYVNTIQRESKSKLGLPL